MQEEKGEVEGEAQSAEQPIPLFGPATPVTRLEGPFAELALRVAFDGLSGKVPALPPLAGGKFGPFDLAGFESTPCVEGLQLNFPMQEKSDDPRSHVPMASMHEKMNLPASLRLRDGSSVTSDMAFFQITNSRHGMGRVEREGVLALDHWVHGSPPAAWFGIIEGLKMERGNIYMSEGRDPLRNGRVARAGMRLQGNYLWHLIERGKECAVLIDPNGATLNPRLLSFDFRALQVTFGKPLSLGILSGLDERGETRCWATPLSGSHRRVGAGNPYGPSPLPDGGRPEVWEPAFFEALAKAMNCPDPKPFFLATHAYLDSVDEGTLDGKYLVLQVALEALCRYDEPSMPDLASDRAAWLSWVKAHEEEIGAFSANPADARILVEHVRQAFQRHQSNDAVQSYFDKLGLSLPDDLRAEINGRHQAVHRLLMNAVEDDERRDFDRDIDRIVMIRTLLIAALAARTGYTGPLLGWDRHREARPSWWKATGDESEARRRYHCSRPSPENPR